MADQVRVFVSHHHSPEEDRQTAQLVRELEAAGADVWVDNQGITSGNFVAKISAGMAGRQWLVLVMTPAALRSQWVQEEVNTALHEVNAKRMLGVLPFMVQPCDEREMPLLWRALHRYDATRDYATARNGLFRATGLYLPAQVARPIISPRAATSVLTPPSRTTQVGPKLSILADLNLPSKVRNQRPLKTPNDATRSKSAFGLPLLSRRQMLIGSGVVTGLAALGGVTWFVRQPRTPLDRLASLGFTLHMNGSVVQYIDPPLVGVPTSTFFMGSDPNKDYEARGDEVSQNQVTLGAFQIARYPLTVAEYAAFVSTGQTAPQDYGGVNWAGQLAKPDHPVVNVSWADALKYAAWLAQLTDNAWRLPNEAAWEKAARGTDGRIYPWGNQWDNTRANTTDGGPGGTTPIGTYPTGASPYGAQDMAGNVEEWTSSLYRPYPYNAFDGREDAHAVGDRVLRGGSWAYNPNAARATARNQYLPANLVDVVGFRLVLE